MNTTLLSESWTPVHKDIRIMSTPRENTVNRESLHVEEQKWFCNTW